MNEITVDGNTLKVGDFFYTSWGYDQTNINFYKVIDITPSGKSVKVQEWNSAATFDDGGPTTYVVPGEGPRIRGRWVQKDGDIEWVVGESPVETKRLRTGGYKNFSFYVSSYADAYHWDGKPKYETGAGWGH